MRLAPIMFCECGRSRHGRVSMGWGLMARVLAAMGVPRGLRIRNSSANSMATAEEQQSSKGVVADCVGGEGEISQRGHLGVRGWWFLLLVANTHLSLTSVTHFLATMTRPCLPPPGCVHPSCQVVVVLCLMMSPRCL